MPAPDRPSSFTTEQARDAFLGVYDQTLSALWPVPIDAQDIETHLGRVRIYRAGPAGGNPVVLLSGAWGNALAWSRYIETIARTHRVIAVDPLGEPGHSVQTRPIVTGTEAGLWLTDVLAEIHAEQAHLVGSSFGGWTALEQQFGDGGRVASLTLVDPAGFAPATLRFYRWVIAGGLAVMLPRKLRHRAADWLGNGTLREDALMKMVFAGRTYRRRLPAPPGFTDDQLRTVSVPVQVLLGERSALHDARQVAARLATVVPKWRVEVVPGTGHALPIEAPELVVERILSFANQTQPGIDGPEPANRQER